MAKALEVFRSLGYQARISADLSDFANPHHREKWQREKGLKVFNISPRYPDITIDLFPESPFPFADEYAIAPRFEMASDLKIPIISIQQLIALKLTVNRLQDQIDVEKLRKIQQLSDVRE